MQQYVAQAAAIAYHERNRDQLRSAINAMHLHSQRSETHHELTTDCERQATFKRLFDDLLTALE